MKKIVAKNIGVDAGMIMVADASYLEDVPKRDDPNVLGEVFDVENGTYNVDWVIPNTWNGKIQGREYVEVTSGQIFISDPCYVIGSNDENQSWLDWLHKTDFGRDIDSDKAFVIDEMGGDGSYTVKLNLEKVS